MAATRWMVTLASFYIMITSCGSFNAFSQYMRITLGYNQQAVNTISFCKELGTSIGILSGFLYEVSGAWLVLLVSSILNFAGYFVIWLCLSEKLPHPQIWQMCIYICLIGASASFTFTAVLVTCANNFSKNPGMLLSLLDSTNGLAVAVFTLLFQAFFSEGNSSTRSFVLLLGWLPSSVMVLLSSVVKHRPNKGAFSKDIKCMYILLVLTVVLAAYLMLVILVQHSVALAPGTIKGMFVVMVFLHLLPIPVILTAESKAVKVSVEVEEQNEQILGGLQEEHDEIEKRCVVSTKDISDSATISTAPRYGDDFTVVQALKSFDLWLMLIATTCGVGAALTVNNNLGQIGISLGYSEVRTNTFVALLNIWDFLGGVATGFFSDVFLKRKGVPRPFFFSLALAILGSGNLVLGIAMTGSLYIGSVLVGLSLGAQWAVLFTMIAEIFGLKNYAVLQNIPTVAKAVGMYFLSVKLAGLLYDRAAKDEHSSICYGAHCYRNTFFVMSGVSMFGCLMSVILAMRTRTFYKNVVRQKI